jgi:hypothetical protein
MESDQPALEAALTSWRGRRCMRISVCNWRTTEADVAVAVEAVKGVLSRR